VNWNDGRPTTLAVIGVIEFDTTRPPGEITPPPGKPGGTKRRRKGLRSPFIGMVDDTVKPGRNALLPAGIGIGIVATKGNQAQAGQKRQAGDPARRRISVALPIPFYRCSTRQKRIILPGPP